MSARAKDEELEQANMALSQAAGVLDVLTAALEHSDREIDLPDTVQGSLLQSIFCAISEINRAKGLISAFQEEMSHGKA